MWRVVGQMQQEIKGETRVKVNVATSQGFNPTTLELLNSFSRISSGEDAGSLEVEGSSSVNVPGVALWSCMLLTSSFNASRNRAWLRA